MRSLIHVSLTTLASLAFLIAIYFEYSIVAALNASGTLLPSTAARYALASTLAFVLLTCVTLRMKYRDEGKDDSSEPGKFFDAKGIFIVAVATSFLAILVTISTGAYDKKFFGTPTNADFEKLIAKCIKQDINETLTVDMLGWTFDATKERHGDLQAAWVLHVNFNYTPTDLSAYTKPGHVNLFIDEDRSDVVGYSFINE